MAYETFWAYVLFFEYGQKERFFWTWFPAKCLYCFKHEKVYNVPFWSKIQKFQALQRWLVPFCFLRLHNTDLTIRKLFNWKNMQRVFSFRTLSKKNLKTEKWNQNIFANPEAKKGQLQNGVYEIFWNGINVMNLQEFKKARMWWIYVFVHINGVKEHKNRLALVRMKEID